MVFFTRFEKEEPPKKDDTEEKIDRVYAEVLSKISYIKQNKDKMPVDLEFVDKTISYKRKSEGEFKKDSYSPGLLGTIKGKKSSIPGVKKAAEKSFSDETDKASVNSIFSLIEDYESDVVKNYYDRDIESMVNSFNNYKCEFQRKYSPVKKKVKFQMRNETMTAALSEIGEDFWKYMHEVGPIVGKLMELIQEKRYPPGIYT